MKFLIVFALAFATVSGKDFYSRSIEVPVLENQGRIANGHVADPGQFYYQVGISIIRGSHVTWCSGSLIGNNWTLTAAHCIAGASGTIVYLGSTRRFTAEHNYRVSGKDIIIHPRFDPNSIKNDIGLIRIPKTSETSRIGIVRIPSNNYNQYVGYIVVIAGWGFSGDNSKVLSNHLRYATLKVSPGNVCAGSFEHFFNIYIHLCVATPNFVSACKGDSGGPLVLDEQNLQIGVFSFLSLSGCLEGLPIVFTRVSAYLAWIKSETGIFY